MGDIKGFLNHNRELPAAQAPEIRVKHYEEFYVKPDLSLLENQSARCMDCGVPFCHSGCPLGNIIPDFNDAVHKNDWQTAYQILSSTNNFPEFTGRICPAPCEASCVLGLNADPVTIELIEKSIIEKAFENDWVKPNSNETNQGKKIGIIGSGPAGLACADELNKMGYAVTVFERSDRIGGLLRYGIPDFKLAKHIIDRRLEVMRTSGITFVTGVDVGADISVEELKNGFDSIVLCGGATVARDLPIPGRQYEGIHAAMDFLTENNKRVAGDNIPVKIDPKGKHILVIGGGDTGADCVGTSNRRGAASVTQIELMAKPPTNRAEQDLWPNWPMILRTSTSHEEGCEREWSVLTTRFVSEDGTKLSGVEIVNISWDKDKNGKYAMNEIPGSKRILPCDLVFLAIGFTGPQQNGLLQQLKVEINKRGNVMTNDYRTSVKNVFAAGDMNRGQSLVVWAIAEGRDAAKAVHMSLVAEDVEQSSGLFV